jgi:REP element-mobilizing transposase RayT
VTFRGNERRAIFRDDQDRRRFLERLRETQSWRPVRLFLACLMPNHVHLLLETPQPHLSAFMGRLLTAYAGEFNRRHRRVGHLTQGRFKAQLVEGDTYLLKLSRYIHLNPVQGPKWAEVPHPERQHALREYRWSSYRSYVGLDPVWEGLDCEPLLALVSGGRTRDARAVYQSYVEAGLAQNDGEFASVYRAARLSLGSSEHARAVRERHEEARRRVKHQEDVAFRRTASWRSAEDVLRIVAQVLRTTVDELRRRRRNSWVRPAAAWALCRHAGLTQRAVADCLGIGTGAAVSRQMRRWQARLETDGAARRDADEITRQLG